MVSPAYLIGAGAAVGAVLRYATNQYVDGVAARRRFPYGTFTVNVVGSFVLALVTFLGAGTDVLYLIGTGACGSYTTFSSFSVDTVRLWETGDRLLAGWYAAANFLGALGGIGLAFGVSTL
ncbi:fluoride efflux transporter FluC [Haloplanus pelagicus]|uniref:fluoride efflux transporter FluC n=1 Tax=Haloplanus pelagicus TaxID=2949995 RepID=UPI00203AD8E4|nr:CrcB family protein [Haloplanus sp. HW8-1]